MIQGWQSRKSHNAKAMKQRKAKKVVAQYAALRRAKELEEKKSKSILHKVKTIFKK